MWTNDDPFDTPFLLEDGSPYIHTQSTVSAAIKVAKFAKHFQSRQSIEVKKIIAPPLIMNIVHNSQMYDEGQTQSAWVLTLQENGLIKTIQTIPHNLFVSFKSPSLTGD